MQGGGGWSGGRKSWNSGRISDRVSGPARTPCAAAVRRSGPRFPLLRRIHMKLARLLGLPCLLLVAGVLSGVYPIFAEDGPKCDLAKVEKRAWCSGCKALPGKEALDEKGGCKKCGDKAKVEQVDACIKTVWLCPKCKDADAAAGTCEDCKQERVAHEVAARVVFACPGCGAKADAAGACTNGACKSAALVRTCSQSGTFPHVGAPAK